VNTLDLGPVAISVIAGSKSLARILALTALCCGPVLAQDANKVSSFVRKACAARSTEMMAAAMEMPADKFDFRPSAQDMSFGQLTLHAAAANYQYCSKIGGVAEPELPAMTGLEAKDRVIERLKASFDFCTAALAKLDDSSKSEMLTINDIKTSRSMAILTLTGSWNDHLALQSSYLQANGRMPPTAKN
jgi:hypothetical protein